MALSFLRPRRPLLVLGLLLSLLLEGPGGCLAEKSFDCNRQMSLNTGSQAVSVKCLQNYYTHSVGCTTLTVTNTNTSTTTFFLEDCQEAVEKDLECFKTEGAKKGFDFSLGGNCVTGKYADFEEVRAQCNIGPKAAVPPDPPHEHETFLLCNCNDNHNCNKQKPPCECNPKYSLCGKNPCSAPITSYKCACEGIPDSPDTPDQIKCVDGKRLCPPANNKRCFSYAAKEGDTVKVFKDCLLTADFAGINCAVNGMPEKNGNCGAGVAREYALALYNCKNEGDWKEGDGDIDVGVPKVDDKARVNVCRCEGELCNADPVTVPKKSSTKSGCGRIAGQGIGPVGVAVMLAARNWT